MTERPSSSRPRWLRVVRDDERAPAPHEAAPDPPEATGSDGPARTPAQVDGEPPAAPGGAAPPVPRPATAGPAGAGPPGGQAAGAAGPAVAYVPPPGPPVGSIPPRATPPGPAWGGRAAAGPAPAWPAPPGSAPLGSAPPASAPMPAGLPPRQAVPATLGRNGRWLLRELAELLAVVVAGTGMGLLADRLVDGLDGRPPAYLLVVLALPLWDLLPHRLLERLGVLVALLAGIATAWWVVGRLRPDGWWRGEVAFGIACALIGALPAVLLAIQDRRARTVGR